MCYFYVRKEVKRKGEQKVLPEQSQTHSALEIKKKVNLAFDYIEAEIDELCIAVAKLNMIMRVIFQTRPQEVQQ